jgi:type I restriction enzyme S subunit
MVSGNLPDGWTIENISKVITKIPLTGRKLPQGDYLESGKYPVIDQGQKYIGGYTNEKELLVPCELPVVIFGDHTKAIKFVNFPFVAGADGVKVIKPSAVFSPKLFYYFLQAIELPNKGYARHFQFLEKETIPVPPLPEQERIVAKIEALFTQLEAGAATLKRVRAGLKRYKASVLKAAVEGRLLENRGIENSDELPEGWRWSTVEQSCERIVDCLHSTPKFTETGHYCVDSTWIKPGIFVFEKARFVDGETFIERNRRMKPQANDVVFSREGALLGVAVHIPENFEFCLGQRMMIFRPANFLNSKFLEFFLNSQVFRSQFAPLITGTASPHLNIGDIRTFRIPLPPLEEQRRIVAEVEWRLSVAQEVESVVAASVARAGRLRQSVLKSAFEGRLG